MTDSHLRTSASRATRGEAMTRTLKDQTADRLRDAIHALRAIADGEDHVMGATELEAIALSSLTALLQSEAQTPAQEPLP